VRDVEQGLQEALQERVVVAHPGAGLADQAQDTVDDNSGEVGSAGCPSMSRRGGRGADGP
jgi:hypothetical protein